MKCIAIATRAVLCGVLGIGVTLATGCGSNDRASEARNFGTLSIPLLSTVGTETYRLDAVFFITGAQDVTLVTSGDERVLSTTLPAGAYSASLQSFSLYKEDATGTFNLVSATVESTTQAFTVFVNSTTTVNFQFETDGVTVPFGSGNVNLTFGVTETAVCTVLGPGCPDGYWCAPPALTGVPLACLPGGTTPIGAACKSPLECVAPATCHDFGVGPICASLCTPDEFGSPCATGGTCVEADPSYGLCNPPCTSITVDQVARTVQSAHFFLDFSNSVADNPEDVDVLQWTGALPSGVAGEFGPNLARTFASDACTSGVVEHFGNSWVPPDPDHGGKVLVGSGSTGSWEQDGASILIRSTSSGCDQSVSVPIETRYTFREGKGADTIEVERQFDLGSTPLSRAFRPYMPRLTFAFDRVLHPDVTGRTLLSENVFNCPNGCALGNWNGAWFAYYASSGPLAGQGLILRREQTGIPAQLWVDYDGGITDTNASSVLLVPPADGFPSQITEREVLCFFDADTWTPDQQAALTLPDGCKLGLECDGSGAGLPSPCEPNPCQHGGTCGEVPNGYECACPPGVGGSNCELVFTQLAAGQLYTCGLRNDGSVACWGSLPYGSAPPISFNQIAVGLYHGCGIRSSDGGITCWGSNDAGQASPPSGSFQSIAAGEWNTCAVSSDGTLSCWGLDGFRNALAPPPAGAYSSVGPSAPIFTTTCAIRTDGTVACFGLSRGGQPPTGTFTAVEASSFEECGIAADKHLACWDFDFRQAQPPPGTFTSLSMGELSACAIRTDGTIACWGQDVGGETSPPSGSFKQIEVGLNYGCAVREDDQVVCWGNNDFGQLTPP